MCGLSGILRPKGLLDEDLYYSSLSLKNLKSRGPDNSKTIKINQKIIFNHTRLSIIDPDKKNNQPLNSFSGRFSIIYNGEIYNYDELKFNLINKNISKKYSEEIKNTFSDTRILIEHLEHFGIVETLTILNGMFSLALYDRKKENIYLARDYYGQKPLFYSNESNLFVFSSLLTDCFRLSRIKPSINKITAQHGIQFGMSLLPETLISGIFELPPGSLMTACIHDQYSVLKSFKDLKKGIEINFKSKTKTKNFSKIFNKVIDRHLIADCDIGLMLSGGIDSSLIASYLKTNFSNKNINTFTLDFPGSNDSLLSSIIAKELGLNHHLIPIEEKNYLSIVEKTFLEVDQPLYDPAIFSSRYINKKAKDFNCKVIITGDGADEVFGGYPRHYKKYLFNSFLPNFLSNKLADAFHSLNNNLTLPRKFNQLMHLFISNSAAESYLNILSDNPHYFLNSEYIQLILQELFINKSTPRLNALIDKKFFLPNKMLFKSDRSSMLESIEARCPYLDLELLSLTKSIDNNIPKRILKEDLKNRITNYPIKKRKEGFKSDFKLLQKINSLIEPSFLKIVPDINETLGIKNKMSNNFFSNNKFIFNNKNPNSSWNYIALAKWLYLNIF